MTRLDIRDVPGFSPLIRDYVHEFTRVAAFYARNPHLDAEYERLAAQCDVRDYRRRELCTALSAQQAAWDAPSAVRQRIADLGDPRGLAVCTGQQTGLFGGPLFTLYKALTTVALAARLQEALRRPVVPLFWMASEDIEGNRVEYIVQLESILPSS